jgi:hypothetical protein
MFIFYQSEGPLNCATEALTFFSQDGARLCRSKASARWQKRGQLWELLKRFVEAADPND